MRLKDLREDADKRQQELAEYLHIRQNTYSQYENGSRQIPIELLIKLAFYYDVSVDYILELTDERRPYPRRISRL
ncbi:MAG: helix-turn-helix transcriptional regulator [Ruminococcaceae bacterium]|nr:helix-turn-helix transcriptional regulator [Oscillospiraceae bacterium]